MKSISVTEVVEGMMGSARSVIVLIDVRSESEFAEAAIPGAVNIPLLGDLARAEIGTLYKHQGADPARRRGLEIVRPLMPRLFHEIGRAAGLSTDRLVEPSLAQWTEIFSRVSKEVLQLDFEEGAEGAGAVSGFSDGVGGRVADTEKPERDLDSSDSKSSVPLLRQPTPHPIIFYCWRGGARSRSMALFASLLGFECSVMSGGHKNFRREVLNFLNAPAYPFKLCTLYGLTGSGKTRIIKKWKSDGLPVIDLEALAHHRGSAFGQVGIDERGRQKDFENNLFWQMKRLANQKVKMIVVEGESRRIGLCQLPENFMNAMLEGLHVQVVVDIKDRVKNILEEYVDAVPRERMLAEARSSLDVLKKRLGSERHKELSDLLADGDYAKFTEELLVHYYDKTYANARAPESFYHGVISGAEEWEKVAALFDGYNLPLSKS